MTSSRRKFLKGFTLTSAYLLSGGLEALTADDIISTKEKVVLRFAVGSDAHYGQPNTEFNKTLNDFVLNVNNFHRGTKLDACVVNGDVIHDKKELLAVAKENLDNLTMNYYVTQGNHDHVTPEYWKEVWTVPMNYEAMVKGNVFLMMTTSNEKGESLSPDLQWMKQKLDEHKQKNVFLFLHIAQQKWTNNSINNPAYAELVKNYTNVKGVFHGHDHDQDGVKMLGTIPHLFDSHIGGNWGTDYKGYRIVELMKDNSVRTYMMNPVKEINPAKY